MPSNPTAFFLPWYSPFSTSKSSRRPNSFTMSCKTRPLLLNAVSKQCLAKPKSRSLGATFKNCRNSSEHSVWSGDCHPRHWRRPVQWSVSELHLCCSSRNSTEAWASLPAFKAAASNGIAMFIIDGCTVFKIGPIDISTEAERSLAVYSGEDRSRFRDESDRSPRRIPITVGPKRRWPVSCFPTDRHSTEYAGHNPRRPVVYLFIGMNK